jgi:hypothetical protein
MLAVNTAIAINKATGAAIFLCDGGEQVRGKRGFLLK